MQFFFKGTDKGFGVLKTQFFTNLRYGFIAADQQLFRPSYTQGPFPVIKALAGTGFDQAGTVGDREAEMIRDVIERNICQMVLHIAEDLEVLLAFRAGIRQGRFHDVLVIAHDCRDKKDQYAHQDLV